MRNIHILPTDKPSRLAIKTNFFSNEVKLHLRKGELFTNGIREAQNQNIFITSDEEIKEGDLATDGTLVGYYSFDEDGCPILKSSKDDRVYGFELAPHSKKIILTTDQDLIKDSVQAITDEFLEWFVKNPSCEKVDIKKLKSGKYWLHKAIIPKEEPKQKETLEEVAERLAYDSTEENKGFPSIKRFIEGAKWQQERSYSEEEVLSILNKHRTHLYTIKSQSDKEWFEQFKKK